MRQYPYKLLGSCGIQKLRSHNLVLQRIANPCPYGRVGSNPTRGVLDIQEAKGYLTLHLGNLQAKISTIQALLTQYT